MKKNEKLIRLQMAIEIASNMMWDVVAEMGASSCGNRIFSNDEVKKLQELIDESFFEFLSNDFVKKIVCNNSLQK